MGILVSNLAQEGDENTELLPVSGSYGRAPEQAHIVQFYESEDALFDAVADFLASGLTAGEPLVVIATEPHACAFRGRLRAKGFDVESAGAAGELSILDAHETLATFMVGSMPDWGLFRRTIGGVLEKSAARGSLGRVRAYGEMVDVLWKDGNPKAAVRLEQMWNDLQSVHEFSLHCAYAVANFYKETDLRDVRAARTHVATPRDGEMGLDGSSARGDGLTQAYARTLAAEIAQRKEVEKALRGSLRDLARTQEELRRSQRELADFVENANIGLHRVGPDGIILWANQAELAILGLAAKDYVGHHVAEFHVDRAAIDDILGRLSRNETVHDFEARLRASDGSIKHVLISSNAYREDGKFVHAQSLTRDLTLRKRAENALRARERQLQTIADALPVMVSYVDAGQHYRFANVCCGRWFRRPKEELLGKHVRELFGAAAYDVLRGHVESALSGKTVTFESPVPYKDGGESFVEATYIPDVAPDGSVRGYTALVADISDKKRIEARRDTAAKRADRLLMITAAIADAVTPDQVFEAVVDQVAAALDASSAALWLAEGDGRSVKILRAVGYSEAAKEKFSAVPLDAPLRFPALDTLLTGEPIWMDSQEELLARYPHLTGDVTPSRSSQVVCLPVLGQGHTLGTLAITFDDVGALGADQRSFLLLVARYSGQALERLRLLDAEKQSRLRAEASAARMAFLSLASRSFATGGADPQGLLQAIAEEVAGDYADGCAVTLTSEQGDAMNLVAMHHRDPEATRLMRQIVEGSPSKLGEGISGRVAATGDAVLLSVVDPRAVLAATAPALHPWLESYLPRSVIFAPLRAHGKIFGTLTAVRQEGWPPFSEEDKQLLEELAERAAMAVESGRLYQENEQGRVRAELLYRLARSVIDADSVDDVFAACLDAIERALGAERSSILVFDPDGVMRFKVWRGLSAEYRRAVEGHSPWARDARNPQPVVVPDVKRDDAWGAYRPLFEQEGIGALGFIPLVAGGRLLGKFMVYYREPRLLSPQELDMARAIANHVAAAISRFAAITDLQESVRFNEMFTAILGHDLRNPLAAILAAGGLAMKRVENDKLLKPLARILSSGERMARMIEQLLDFTRLRVSGGLPLQPSEVDLVPVLRQVMDELDDANPEWTLRLEHTGNTRGLWDHDRLCQLFSNLIGNAVQHGVPQHGVRVRVDGTSDSRVRIEVHNMGVVPEELLPKVFEPMIGGDRRRENSHGLGLGLFITQQIARAHGGAIDVQSNESLGTVFNVSLPRAIAR